MTKRVTTDRRNRVEIASQLRVVIYARKSGPGDRSPADQEKVGRRDCETQGFVVADVFKDNLSASRYRRVDERPGFVQTMKSIRSGRVDMLWTFANNRAHRTLDDYVELRRLCVETGVLWRYGNRTYDLTLSADRQATASDALRSEGQSDDISDAVNRGIQTALEENRAHGKLLRGYRIVRDEHSGRPITREPIPEQAALISRAADRVLWGESVRSVCAWFVPEWTAAGGAGVVNPIVLRHMLINPTYAGFRTHKGEIHGRGNWAPILTMEQHQALRTLLTDPGRRTQRGTAPAHLLSFIAMCGKCSGRVKVRLPRAKLGEKSSTYQCPDGHVSRGQQRVDVHVEEAVVRLFERPETLAKLTARDAGEQTTIDEELAEIERLRAREVQFVKEAARERLSAAQVAAYVAVVQEDITAAQARVDAMIGAADPLLASLVGKDARARWVRRDLMDKRVILARYFEIKILPVASRGPSGELGVSMHPLKILA